MSGVLTQTRIVFILYRKAYPLYVGGEILMAWKRLFSCLKRWLTDWKSLPWKRVPAWTGLIRQLVSEHLEHRENLSSHRAERSAPRKRVYFPSIPGEETGAIPPFTGSDLDEMLALDDFPS
jgi:hypothetical protein